MPCALLEDRRRRFRGQKLVLIEFFGAAFAST
jgi:hypothetical protein